MIDLRRDGEVFVLEMQHAENRFRPDFVAAWNEALDEGEAAPGPRALVTTGSGKFYSNGLDLDWMTGEEPAHTVQNILAMLPDDMKSNISF